jgi:hypothetical protein
MLSMCLKCVPFTSVKRAKMPFTSVEIKNAIYKCVKWCIESAERVRVRRVCPVRVGCRLGEKPGKCRDRKCPIFFEKLAILHMYNLANVILKSMY